MKHIKLFENFNSVNEEFETSEIKSVAKKIYLDLKSKGEKVTLEYQDEKLGAAGRNMMKLEYKENQHRQSKVYFEVDDKIAPLIQHIINNYPSVVPFASCEGGLPPELGDDKWYIMFLVRDMSQFNRLCNNLGIMYVEYQIPTNEFANTPSFTIRDKDIEKALERIKLY